MQKYHIYNIDMKKEAKGATVIDGLSLPIAITSSAKKLENALDKWIKIIQ